MSIESLIENLIEATKANTEAVLELSAAMSSNTDSRKEFVQSIASEVAAKKAAKKAAEEPVVEEKPKKDTAAKKAAKKEEPVEEESDNGLSSESSPTMDEVRKKVLAFRNEADGPEDRAARTKHVSEFMNKHKLPVGGEMEPKYRALIIEHIAQYAVEEDELV